jgi:hypothetical protein
MIFHLFYLFGIITKKVLFNRKMIFQKKGGEEKPISPEADDQRLFGSCWRQIHHLLKRGIMARWSGEKEYWCNWEVMHLAIILSAMTFLAIWPFCPLMVFSPFGKNLSIGQILIISSAAKAN